LFEAVATSRKWPGSLLFAAARDSRDDQGYFYQTLVWVTIFVGIRLIYKGKLVLDGADIVAKSGEIFGICPPPLSLIIKCIVTIAGEHPYML
jgi:hypothetical protein